VEAIAIGNPGAAGVAVRQHIEDWYGRHAQDSSPVGDHNADSDGGRKSGSRLRGGQVVTDDL
jgi:hypothetical protein